jgi:hypothetical protein
MKLDNAKTLFASFLKRNPHSSIDEMTLPDGNKGLAIKTPWGDESLALKIPDVGNALAKTLEHVLLPERFTALWHEDSKELEVVWTASPLVQPWIEVENRKFEIARDGKTYVCEFSASSDRLVTIAKHAIAISSSVTNYRNLLSYKQWDKAKADASNKARSFWVRNIEWDENAVLDLVRHLNFYMTYYDHLSPTILVHSPKVEAAMQRRARYAHGKFPSKIDTKSLNEFLLYTWEATREGDAARRFLYAYRVIEFASFTYMESEVRSQLRKLLSTPHALDDIHAVADAVAAVTHSKWDDFTKFANLIQNAVSPALIWTEISGNMKSFTAETKFDGGFVLSPLAAEGCRQQDIQMFTLARHLKDIRNALAHGRDQKTGLVIAPTTRTFQLLTPWAHVASVVAGEIILYKDVV